MKKQAIATAIYALLILGGGIFGFYKAHSVPSLIAGTSFGVLLLTSACAMARAKRTVYGRAAWWTAIALTSFLVLFFAYRFYATGNFMPSGLMAALSASTLIYLTIKKCDDKSPHF